MATAEFVTGPGTQSASLSLVPSIHSIVGQPIIDINGLNGDTCDSRKRPLEAELDGGMATKRTNLGSGPGGPIGKHARFHVLSIYSYKVNPIWYSSVGTRLYES